MRSKIQLFFLLAAMPTLAQQPGQLARLELSVAPGLPMRTAIQSSGLIAAPDAASLHDRFMNRLWLTSAAAVVSATAADAATSWSYNESNSLLASRNGSFGARGLGIKMGTAGALLVPQYLLRHHKQLRSKFIAANFAGSGVYGVTAVHNILLVNSLK